MKFNKKELTQDTYYVGVNDRTKARFEDIIPLTYGVAYNSYLIMDEKTALMDSVDVCMGDLFIDKLLSTLDGRTLDYLIINHIEPDHSGAIRTLRQHYPNVQIIGNKKTLSMLDGFYGMTDNILEIKDGETISLGKHELTFILTPMVHWPETMMTYDSLTQTIFTGDAFGAFGALDGGVLDTELDLDRVWDEMYRYYANIVGKYGVQVQKAFGKLSKYDIKMICSTHGPVWTAHKDKAMEIYNQLSKGEAAKGVVIVYGSMYGNTEIMAEAVAQGLREEGIRNVIIHNASKSDDSFILRDIFKYKGLVIGSTTYNGDLHPCIKNIVAKIENRGIKNKEFAYFSSFSWGNVADKMLKEFAEKTKWNTVEFTVSEKMGVKKEGYQSAIQLGKELAKQLQD